MALFNVRVYGILINERREVLISDEQEHGYRFTKFPGGGLEYGEGTLEGLKREFLEECNASIEITAHCYTTDFYVKSAFNDSQIISIYYYVTPLEPLKMNFKTEVFDFDGDEDVMQAFRWVKLSELQPQSLTFPIDQHVAALLIQQQQ